MDRHDYVGQDHTRKTLFNTFSFHINKFGSRNTFELSMDDRDSVALLGDSFIFGYGLNDDETLPYFLSQLDTQRRYINAGGEGFNVCNCVERYLKISKRIAPPRIVVLSITGNDLFDNEFVFNRALMEVENDYRHVLFPFRSVVSKNMLLRHYWRGINHAIQNDMTPERYQVYIQNPLSQLLRHLSGTSTRLCVLCYDDLPAPYDKHLKEFCADNSILLVSAGTFDRRGTNILPDTHPSARYNRLLAAEVHRQLDAQGLLH